MYDLAAAGQITSQNVLADIFLELKKQVRPEEMKGGAAAERRARLERFAMRQSS